MSDINTSNSDNSLRTITIVVIGAVASGKSTFIQIIADEKLYDELTVSIPFADGLQLEEQEFKMQLFAGVGYLTLNDSLRICLVEPHIPSDWQHVFLDEKPVAFLSVVNSARPETLREAAAQISTAEAYARVPYVVADNHYTYSYNLSMQAVGGSVEGLDANTSG